MGGRLKENDAMQLRCHARECEGIWAVPHRRDPYRVSDIDGWWSRQNQSRARSRARVESDGARRSTTAPDMCRYASDAPSKPDDAWRSPPRALMSWYGETACPLHGLQETEHVTGSAAFCLDAGESGGPHAGCTQGFTQSHSCTVAHMHAVAAIWWITVDHVSARNGRRDGPDGRARV